MACEQSDTIHYFDNAASSLLSDICIKTEQDYDNSPWAGANPSSLHYAGRQAFNALENARHSLARSLGAQRPSEITFTSGGTESNNAALCGIAHAVYTKTNGKRNRVLVSAFEHDSILELKGRLAGLGIRMETLGVGEDGFVNPEVVDDVLEDDVALVSIMTVNNEIGSIQPIADISRIAHEHGALMHTDAVQALGKTSFDVKSLGIDAASVTAHKIGGPIGIGALYLRAHTPFEPLILGGGQESGLRSGTTDVRGALAFAAVAHDTVVNLQEHTDQLKRLETIIVDGLTRGDDPVARLAVPRDDKPFVPGTLCFVVPGHDSQSLVLALDALGFEVAGGSACSSSSLDPSHVLSAVGIPRDLALCELRISFDERVSPTEAAELVDAVRKVCGR